MISGLRRKRGGFGAVLRFVSLAIFLAFGVGFGIGLWIRCAMERPEGYLAEAATAPGYAARSPGPGSDASALPVEPRSGAAALRAKPGSGAAALPLDVRLAGAAVGDPRQHEE